MVSHQFIIGKCPFARGLGCYSIKGRSHGPGISSDSRETPLSNFCCCCHWSCFKLPAVLTQLDVRTAPLVTSLLAGAHMEFKALWIWTLESRFRGSCIPSPSYGCCVHNIVFSEVLSDNWYILGTPLRTCCQLVNSSIAPDVLSVTGRSGIVARSRSHNWSKGFMGSNRVWQKLLFDW